MVDGLMTLVDEVNLKVVSLLATEVLDLEAEGAGGGGGVAELTGEKYTKSYYENIMIFKK